jgi:hypothetical protein
MFENSAVYADSMNVTAQASEIVAFVQKGVKDCKDASEKYTGWSISLKVPPDCD